MKTKYIMTPMIMMAFAVFLAGCTSSLKPIFNKTYSLTLKVEAYVANADVETFVNTIDNLKPPINILIQSVDYIGNNTNKEDVQESLAKISNILKTVLLVAEEVNVENVEQKKEELLVEITNVKDSMEETALKLNIKVDRPRVGKVTLAMLEQDIRDLEEMLKD